MRIHLVGSSEPLHTLEKSVKKILKELNLDHTVELKVGDDPSYKVALGITENPALCIEEESIEFQDILFQGIVPSEEEIRSMFISIFWDEEESHGCSGGCSTGWCDTCAV